MVKDERRFPLILPSERDTSSSSSYCLQQLNGAAPRSTLAQKDKHKRVVLDFHGGAYVALNPRLPNPQSGPKILGEEMSAIIVMCLRFPGRNFVLSIPPRMRHPTSEIILSGVSADGDLAVSLLKGHDRLC